MFRARDIWLIHLETLEDNDEVQDMLERAEKYDYSLSGIHTQFPSLHTEEHAVLFRFIFRFTVLTL